MNPRKIIIKEKLALFNDYWNPKIIGDLNGQQVKLVKLKGEFIWHHHDHEDELFYVLKGILKMAFRDTIVEIGEGEMIIIPRGVEHKPIAVDEVHLMLFEPASTLNTGNEENDRTRKQLQRL